MTVSIVEEMAVKIATELDVLGYGTMKGVVYQIAPDYDITNGTLLGGTLAYPFVSISHVQAEQFLVGESFNAASAWSRTLTVAIIADKAIVARGHDPYVKYRESAIKTLHLNRFRGSLPVNTTVCIFHAIIRPNSPIQQSAWQSMAKFVSSFDVVITTHEDNGV